LAFDRLVSRLLSFALVLFVLVLSSGRARAQSAVERETARQLMQDGFARQARGDHAAALESFQRADAIMHAPTTGLEVGRSLAKLGKIVEARDVLRRVARLPDQAEDPAVYRAAKKEASTLATDLADKLASLRIVPSDREAQISVDGSVISPALRGVDLKVNPGEHVVAARGRAAPAEVRVTVGPGEVRQVALSVPAAPDEPPSGPRRETPEADSSSGLRRAAWIGLAGGAAALVAGAVTGGFALSRKNDAAAFCRGSDCLPEAQGDLDAARTFAGISTAAFVVGGALAIASGAVLLFKKERGLRNAVLTF
jgi:hypothetical protein